MLYRNDFDSYEEFLQHVDTPNNGERIYESSHTGSYGFTGTHSYKEAMSLARNGWEEGRTKLVKAMASIERPHGTRHQVTYDVAGAVPDIARYIAGDPEHMVTYGEDLISRKPVVKLVFNPGVSWQVSKDMIIRRGAATLSYVDELENMGYSVELTMMFVVNGGSYSDRFIITMPLKAAGEPLDMDRMGFVMAHPSFLRRLLFRVYEARPEHDFMSKFPAYGYPSNPTENELDDGGYIPSIVPSEEYRWGTTEKALGMVRDGVNGKLNLPTNVA